MILHRRLSESELAQVMEGFWDEANTFWGDTWRSAAKGAGAGAGAGAGVGGAFGGLPGAGVGAGIGGLLGGVGGGLYGMGKHLWHHMRKPKDPEATPEAPRGNDRLRLTLEKISTRSSRTRT